MFGILNINKPVGITSRRVIDRIARHLGKVKAGHAGTLDPLAEGVLVVCLGPATRLINRVQRLRKHYRAIFRLGQESDTLDIEGELREIEGAPVPSQDQLERTLRSFIGRIQQVPPKYSAVKVDGHRAYQLARRDADVELSARPVDVFSIKLCRYEYPDFEVEIECGSGTYVRSLGRDIAEKMMTSAVMTSLQRTRIGIFDITNSIDVAEFSRQLLLKQLISPTELFRDANQVQIEDDQFEYLANGGLLDFETEEAVQELVAIGNDDRLVAVLARSKSGAWKPSTNFSKYWLDEATKKSGST